MDAWPGMAVFPGIKGRTNVCIFILFLVGLFGGVDYKSLRTQSRSVFIP
jgi:hypothetical protein